MRHIIFDLDGTLLDSMWVWEMVDDEFLRQQGHISDLALRRQLKVLSIHQSARFLQEHFQLQMAHHEIVDSMREIVQEKYQRLVTFKPDALDYLQQLARQGVQMCLATATERCNAQGVLEKYQVLSLFAFLYTGDEITTGKNDPEVFRLCCQRLGADPHQVTVFEDSLHAVIAAKEAGCRVIGVADPSSAQDAPQIMAAADKYITDFNQMPLDFSWTK